MRLKIDYRITYTLDLRPKVSIYQAEEKRKEIKTQEAKPEGENVRFSRDIIDLLDWQKIWLEMLEFKAQRGYWNLVFDKKTLENILLSDRYSLNLFSEIFDIKSREDIQRLEDVALLVIKKYIDLFYRKKAKEFERDNLSYKRLSEVSLPFLSNERYYTLQIDRNKKELIEKIRELIDKLNEEEFVQNDLNKVIYEDLPRIYFDRSLYIPLLVQSKEIDKISPVPLVESEKIFVEGLMEYWKSKSSEYQDIEIYLLRNYPFSGIGFQLQWAGFYPDFIMWIKNTKKQIIVFIDPKGLEHTKGLNDEKIVFAGVCPPQTGVITIKDIENELREKLSNPTIVLESFILSNTPYNTLIKGIASPPSKDEYIKHHVLFLEDKDWPKILFDSLLANAKTAENISQ